MKLRAQLRPWLGRGHGVQTNASYLVQVGLLRHLQNSRERGVRKGPDWMVRYFLNPYWVRRAVFTRMTPVRADPFYNYLLARTRFYDECVRDAITSGVRQVLILGAGTDTRAYRFEDALRENDIRVVEADQSAAINEKERTARQLGEFSHVRWLQIDLKTVDWSAWIKEAGLAPSTATVVMMEGVSPYLPEDSYARMVRSLVGIFGKGSRFALDFKLRGHSDEQDLCRLPDNTAAIDEFHRALGLTPTVILRGEEVQQRYCGYGGPTFKQDAVLYART